MLGRISAGDNHDLAHLGKPPYVRRGGAKSSSLDQVATRSYVQRMRSVGIKVLNSRLSEYLRLAAAGEVVLVTDRDRVVAEIGPPRETRSTLVADAVLADAVRNGWLTPPVLAPREPLPDPARVAPLDEILRELDQDRTDR